MSKNITIEEKSSNGNIELIELFHIIERLKSTTRSGWLRCKIPSSETESVAAHTFRTTFIAMLLGDKLGLNTEKLMRLAILHDLAEAIIGDITPYDNISTEEKRSKEAMALLELFKSVPNGSAYITLWNEFDQGSSTEAKLIRNIDKFEMALQASEYQDKFEHMDLDLTEFFTDAENYLTIPEIKELYELMKMKITTKKEK